MTADHDMAAWQAVKAWGGRGVREAVIPQLAATRLPGITVAECWAAVERLVARGCLYRSRRRSRTLVKVGPRPDQAPPAAAPQGLWEVDC